MGVTYICGFCGKTRNRDKDRPAYIYPVPIAGEAGQTLDNREGRYACSKCTVEQKRLQREMGLVEDHHYIERN